MRPLLADAASDLVGYLVTAVAAVASAVVALFFVREKERSAWFEKLTAATESLNSNADAIENLSKRVEDLSREVIELKQEVQLLRARSEKVTP